MKAAEVIIKISKLPENFLQSASDYIDYLLEKANAEAAGEKHGIRKYGTLKGKLWIADDFDAPLDEMKEYIW